MWQLQKVFEALILYFVALMPLETEILYSQITNMSYVGIYCAALLLCITDLKHTFSMGRR